MKKFFYLLLLVVFCSSCYNNYDMFPKKDSNAIGCGASDFIVIEIDSCEYVFKRSPYQGYLAHKGNCKYCEQRRKREQEQLFKIKRKLN